MWRNVFLNVTHLMLILTVLEFSALILYQAVLSCVGVGLSMNSFGGMVNPVRSETVDTPQCYFRAILAMLHCCGPIGCSHRQQDRATGKASCVGGQDVAMKQRIPAKSARRLGSI